MMLNKNKASDSPSKNLSSSNLVHKTKSTSFFPIPKLFIGLSSKALSDLDPTKSPTSPLDLKSPKSPKFFNHNNNNNSPKFFNSNINNSTGLGLVNHLYDENKFVGSPLRLTSTKSLPKDYGYLCKIGSTKSLPKDHGYLCKIGSADLSKSGLGNNGSGLNDDLLGKSLPIIGSLNASEIEKSEDYTCIISYGPNGKKTHIFGDCILESHVVNLENKEVRIENGLSGSFEKSFGSDNDFLSFCFACKKKLDGKDIYIYRGEKAFCSCDCRDNEISIEEESEKIISSDLEDCDCIFMAGMIVAT